VVKAGTVPGDHGREGELLGEALLLQVVVLIGELGGNVAVFNN